MRDALGNETTYDVTPSGDQVGEHRWRTLADGTEQELFTRYDYYQTGVRTGYLRQTTYPDETTDRVELNTNLQVTARFDRLNRATRYEYDDQGRLLKTTYPDTKTEEVRYDKEGRRRYLDCVWVLPDGQVVVLEIDGSFHADVSTWWRDMKRERAVVVQGDRVLRCSTIELRLEPADIIDDLKRAGVPSLDRFVHAS